MFAKHPDKMRMEPTPERVLCVCQLVGQGPISKNDLVQSLSLRSVESNNQNAILPAVRVALNELGMLKMQDDKLIPAVPNEAYKTPKGFRQHVASIVFTRKDTTFYRFSKWYLSQNDRVFQFANWESTSKTAERECSELKGVGENAALGWRFWATFLGLGYLNGTVLIPNLKIRIQDILSSDFSRSFSFGEAVHARDFLVWISHFLPEVEMNPPTPLPLGLSAGLRTLHELGLIVLEARMDTERIPLFEVDGEEFNEFSHITVRKEVSE